MNVNEIVNAIKASLLCLEKKKRLRGSIANQDGSVTLILKVTQSQ
jgi:hypothetical protein